MGVSEELMSQVGVYVCAPWRDRTETDEANTDAAIQYLEALGRRPVFLPYELRNVYDDRDPTQRAHALRMALDLVAALRATHGQEIAVVLGEAKPFSEGMLLELATAFAAGYGRFGGRVPIMVFRGQGEPVVTLKHEAPIQTVIDMLLGDYGIARESEASSRSDAIRVIHAATERLRQAHPVRKPDRP